MMKSLEEYGELLQQELDGLELPKRPEKLYESIEYILSLGGKRLRPLMVLMGADLAEGVNNDSLTASLVVELFHNFSLMHDDIMDNADLRRGKEAVHIKWNIPTAILGGDALLVKTYELLMQLTGPRRDEVINLYNKTALQVCEGQQMDINFETRDDVSLDEYIEMIRLKTAVIMGAAFKTGAMTANGTQPLQDALYSFGENLGIAFQIKDDYLDCYGEAQFGKKTGGDIIENKKTYLQLSVLSEGSSEHQNALKKQWGNEDEQEKVELVKDLFDKSGAKKRTEQVMNQYYQRSLDALIKMPIEDGDKQSLTQFATAIWNRSK